MTMHKFIAIRLSAGFVTLDRAETFALADACGAGRAAVDAGESALCGQFIAMGYTAAESGMSVEDTLADWHRDYARSKGASVSDKGRVSTTDMPEDAKAAYVKVRNSFNVAKSAIVKAVELTDKIVPLIEDGGSVLLDANGMPRSKGELLAFIKAASSKPKSELEKAVSRLMAAYAAAAKLTDAERDIFDDTARALATGELSAVESEDDAE